MAAAVPLLAACGAAETGPPAIVLDQTPCAHCRMLVSDLAYAAAFRTREGEERVFDEIGCMLRELPAAGARVFVHDYETSQWLEGEKAFFLRSESIQTPMGGGIVAFSSRAAAEKYEGQILPLARLQGDLR
jgi:copper chaperone NosL